jgi:hypothetical protein
MEQRLPRDHPSGGGATAGGIGRQRRSPPHSSPEAHGGLHADTHTASTHTKPGLQSGRHAGVAGAAAGGLGAAGRGPAALLGHQKARPLTVTPAHVPGVPMAESITT